MLEKELIARKLSQKEFARQLGISSNAIKEIIKGKKTITAETTLQLEEAIPTFPARFWLYLQSGFQLAKTLSAKNSLK
jgi:addiction module HigA family antidote